MSLETVLVRDRDYRITLEIKERGCSSKQIQTVRIPDGGCRSRIRVDGDGVLSVRSTGVPPLQYNWMNQSKDSTFRIVNLNSVQNRNVWVQVTDANGCISESEIGFDPSNRKSSCIADFEYSAKRIVNRDHLQLGRVTIDYINENGAFFTSNFLQQPANSFFEILTVEDFEENAAGQPTKKLNMEFLTTLYAPDTDETMQLKGKTIFAVAYPKQ